MSRRKRADGGATDDDTENLQPESVREYTASDDARPKPMEPATRKIGNMMMERMLQHVSMAPRTPVEATNVEPFTPPPKEAKGGRIRKRRRGGRMVEGKDGHRRLDRCAGGMSRKRGGRAKA